MTKREATKIVNIYFKRIDKGIAWLDKTAGRNKWLKKVDWKMLDLGDNETCVLGQAFTDYFKVVVGTESSWANEKEKQLPLKKGQLTTGQSSELGFDVGDENHGSYDILSRCWTVKLMKLNKCNF